MRTPDIEGVAIHDGPESCAGTCEGAGEAFTGVRAGWAIEPRNHHFGVPTPSHEAEGHISGGASASRRGTPRGLRPCACTESSCARTGRSRARPPGLIAGRAAQGTLRR